MTAGERLLQLAGQAGAAGVLLLLIGTGATAGQALTNYSELPSATAEQHLLVDKQVEQLGGGRKRKLTEKELWANLPDPYVFKPKIEEVKIEVVEKVFLPSSEVSPDEVATIAREVAKKFTKSTIVVEDDDEEAILFLLGVL